MVAQQFLTFTLAEELYAVDVAQVREVLSDMQLTVIPRMPNYYKGVINIRGSVVPVVDLRTRFGLESIEQTIDTSIIVMDVRDGNGLETVTVGCLTDTVQEVVSIAEESVEPVPTVGTTVGTQFIRGLGKMEDRFVIMLDMDRVFGEIDGY